MFSQMNLQTTLVLGAIFTELAAEARVLATLEGQVSCESLFLHVALVAVRTAVEPGASGGARFVRCKCHNVTRDSNDHWL